VLEQFRIFVYGIFRPPRTVALRFGIPEANRIRSETKSWGVIALIGLLIAAYFSRHPDRASPTSLIAAGLLAVLVFSKTEPKVYNLLAWGSICFC